MVVLIDWKDMKKSKIYVVCGHNGDWGHTVLGLYPTEDLALIRINEIKDAMQYESVWFSSVEAGQYGIDCEILIR
jgi:hypothetical protein